MNRRGHRPARNSRSESGYALLFAVFLAATMFLLASVATPSIINNGRREREQQLIWRGNQYVRGIRLYFQKNGRFPQNKEELLKGTLDVHFVRKPFTDPVGTKGADWRFIYVAPSSGQLTGSVRYRSLQEMAAALGTRDVGNLAAILGGAPGTPQGAAPVGAAGAAAAGRGGAGAAGAAGARGGPGAAGAGAGRGGPGQAAGAAGGGLTPAGSGPTPVPLQAVDGPVFGASLVGVASKVKRDSLMVYKVAPADVGKANYFEWEFIWNPLMNRGPGGAPVPGAPVAAPAGAGTGLGNLPPLGGTGGTGQQQGPAPGQTPGPGQMPGPGVPGMPGFQPPR